MVSTKTAVFARTAMVCVAGILPLAITLAAAPTERSGVERAPNTKSMPLPAEATAPMAETREPAYQPLNVRWTLVVPADWDWLLGQHDMSARLHHEIDLRVGPAMAVNFAFQRMAGPPTAGWLARRAPAIVGEQAGPGDVELCSAVNHDGLRWTAITRSWQTAVSSESTSDAAVCEDFAALSSRLADQLVDVVQPVAVIQSVAPNQRARLAPFAVGLLADEHPLVVKWSERVLTPTIRFRSRQGAVKKIQPVPWTLLRVTGRESNEFAADVVTGIRSSLSAKQRGAIEMLAVGLPIWPVGLENRVESAASLPSNAQGNRAVRNLFTIQSQSRPVRPLAGLSVRLLDRPWQPLTNEQETASDFSNLMTDRLGRVILPVQTPGAIRWINVFSGEQLLGRVPFVEGSRAPLILELPDDKPRLFVEGELAVLKDAIIEAVAARGAWVSVARRAARAGDWTRLGYATAEFEKLPGFADLMGRLAAIRVRGVARAREVKQKALETRITRLCEETATLIQKFCSDEVVNVAREELQDLNRLQHETPDADRKPGTATRK